MTTSVTLQMAEAHPPDIDEINRNKSGDNIITTNSGYLEDVYRGELSAFSSTPIPIAYILNADNVSYSYTKDIVPINLPASDTTPEQLKNNFITFGISQERIALQGVLVDRLPDPDAAVDVGDNRTYMTKHRFLNIARRQWEHVIEDVPNPLAYPRLTIVNPGDFTERNRVDVSNEIRNVVSLRSGVVGFPRRYRGIISELTFNLQGGRPDIWNWRMNFTIMKNENFWLRDTAVTFG